MLGSAFAQPLAWARWCWHFYASSCGVLGVGYAIQQLSLKVFVTMCLSTGTALGMFVCKRRYDVFKSEADKLAKKQAKKDAWMTQKQALREAQADSQRFAEQAREYQTQLDAQWTEMQRLRDADSNVCKICFDRTCSCVLLPCKHHAFCTPCAYQLKEGTRNACCPLCRTAITGIFETFAS